MEVFDDINAHNHKLAELSNVLMFLLQERSMCDTETANALLSETLKRIDEHMEMVGQLYQGLLMDKAPTAHSTAHSFMSGERELKRIVLEYKKTWFAEQKPELRVADHGRFVKDTGELFEIVLSRIQDETEHLYPLVRTAHRRERGLAGIA